MILDDDKQHFWCLVSVRHRNLRHGNANLAVVLLAAAKTRLVQVQPGRVSPEKTDPLRFFCPRQISISVTTVCSQQFGFTVQSCSRSQRRPANKYSSARLHCLEMLRPRKGYLPAATAGRGYAVRTEGREFPVSFAGVQIGRHVANPFFMSISGIGKVDRDRPASFRLPLIQRRCRQNRRRTGSCLCNSGAPTDRGRGTDVPGALNQVSRFPTRLASKKQRFCLSCLHQTPGDRRDPGRDAGRTIGAIRPPSKKKVNTVFVKTLV